MAEELTPELLVTQAIERQTELHGIVYHIITTTSPAPTLEGMSSIDIGNVRLYIPAGWKLGTLAPSNMFRPLLDHRFTTLVEIQAGVRAMLELMEKERKDKEEAERRYIESRRLAKEQAIEQQERAKREEGKKEAPKPRDLGAS